MPDFNKFSFKFRLPEFILVVLLLLSGTALAFSSGSFILNFNRLGFTVLSSFQKGINTAANGVKDTFNAVQELGKLRREYDELTRKLENYQQMQRSNADIRKENERLREQLNFSMSLEEKNYPARIIGRDADNIHSFITIDKGSSSGIRKNMPVIAYQSGVSGLVGKVVQVGTFTSIVMPVYNLKCSISARLQNTRDFGLVTGLGNHYSPLIMTYVRKQVRSEIKYGDIVVTSGENSNYMRDIPIGTISKISAIEYNSSLEIELMPIIDFSRLENVVVVNMREINNARENVK